MKHSKQIILFILLSAFGFLGNIYNIEMFFGINQVFGSIFVLIAVWILGYQAGVLCAIIVHAYTIVLWGHPYAFISFVLEAFCVGLLLKKRNQNIFIADCFYWFFLGVPLAYIFYGMIMKMPDIQVMTIMLKQPANALLNALIATLAVQYLPIEPLFLNTSKKNIQFRHLLWVLIMGFTLFSLFITANMIASHIFNKRMDNIKKEVTCFSKQITHKIDMFKTQNLHLANAYYQLYSSNNRLIQLDKNNPFERIYLWQTKEKKSILIASKKMSAHPFPSYLVDTDLTNDILFFPDNNHSFYIVLHHNNHILIGIQSINNLDTLLNSVSDMGGYQNIIVPETENVTEISQLQGVYHNRSFHLKGYKDLLKDNLYVLFPENSDLPKMMKWKQSYMVIEVSCIGKGFKLAIKKSLQSMVNDLQQLYIYIFSLMLLLIIIALVVSGWISSRIVSPIQALSLETSNLPDKLLNHQEPQWSKCTIDEINTLIENIKDVSQTLHYIFQESENRYKKLFSHTTDALFVVEPTTFEIIDANLQAEMLTGISRKDLKQLSIAAFFDNFHFEQNNVDESFEDFKCNVINNNSRIPVSIRMQPMRYRQNDVYFFVVKNIKDSIIMQEQLHLVAKVYETTHDGILITDAKKRIIMVNKSFEMITGYTSDELVGKDPSVMSSGWHDRTFYQNMWQQIYLEGMWKGEIKDRRKNGEVFTQILSIYSVKDNNGKLTNYIGISVDITEKKEAQKRINKLANYDMLTDLPNRTTLITSLSNAISMAKQNALKLGLIIIDMDNFNTINDSYGHKTADLLLKKIVDKIYPKAKEIGTMGRMGSDTFAIVFEKLNKTEELAYFSQHLLTIFDEPFHIDKEEIYTSASFGICLYPDDANTAEKMVQNADIAMHRAKEYGKRRFEFYKQEQNISAREKLSIENGLRKAIQNDQLTLYYQPQVAIHDGKLIGCEALSRWIHPEKGFIPPDIFIPVAEECGLVGDIEIWMLKTASRQIKKWRDSGFNLIMSVNISNYQFRKKDFVEILLNIINAEQAKCEWFELELTERIVMDHEEVIEKLNILKGLGFQIALDDFGTGYSSLAYLKKFKIDKLKIDKSFIQDLPDDPQSRDIARAIVSLTASLNMESIAEGVEDQGQLDFLNELNCQFYQGYFFSKPVPAEAFEKNFHPSYGLKSS